MNRRMFRLAITAAVCILAGFLNAQNPDQSGTPGLRGPYFVREVLLFPDYNTTNISRAFSFAGIITFDGAGHYSFQGQELDSGSNSGKPQGYNVSGTYNVAGNGFFEMQSLVSNPTDPNSDYVVYGASTPSGIVGSMTEGNYNDIFIAIPSSGSATTSTINGQYLGISFNVGGGNPGNVSQAYFTLNADGTGHFSPINVTGSAVNLGSTPVTQLVFSATYSTAGTGGAANFGTASTSQLLSGNKVLFVSADGNLLLGGSLNDYDIFFAMRSLATRASNSTLSGTYYTASIEDDASQASSGQNGIASWYGSSLGLSNGTTLNHERYNSVLYGIFDYTLDLSYNIGSNGVDATNTHNYYFAVGDGGQAFISLGGGSQYSFKVGLQAANYVGANVFISPVGILNSASYDPITNPVAPGELVTIFGSGLAQGTFGAQSTPLSTNLGGVQVLVNGTPSPLVFVSPTQINLLAPQTLAQSTSPYATFQVVNGLGSSNMVTVFSSPTAPGVFTLNAGETGAGQGNGPGAVLHSNFTLVTPKNPAHVGETVLVYLTGLGATNPSVPDGAASPASPLSSAVTNTGALVDGIKASISFAGLAPGFVGLYQVNVTIPTGVRTGQYDYVDISTNDAYTSQAVIYVQ